MIKMESSGILEDSTTMNDTANEQPSSDDRREKAPAKRERHRAHLIGKRQKRLRDGYLGGLRYFAFISYSSVDRKKADKIHRWLERYRFPARLARQKNIPRTISPVCIDHTYFSGTSIGDIISDKINESKCEVVVCSPNSAQSRWVGEEIKTAASAAHIGAERIFPVIIDGKPHSGNATECFNPELDSLEESLGADITKDGFRNGMLHLVANMYSEYDVTPDMLIRLESKRRVRRTVLASVAIIVLLAAVSVFAYLAIPRQASYANVVYHDYLPVCVGEKLSNGETARMDRHYVVTTQYNRIIKVECLNSSGSLSDKANEAPLVELEYIGSTVEKTLYDEHEVPELKEIIRPNDNGCVVDRVSPYDDSMPLGLPADYTLPLGEGDGGNSTASRLVVTDERSETGKLLSSRTEFFDPGNTAMSDANAIHGIVEEYNEKGFVARKYLIGLDGERKALSNGVNAVVYFEYDECGRPISYYFTDKKDAAVDYDEDYNYSAVVYERDEYGNILSTGYYSVSSGSSDNGSGNTASIQLGEQAVFFPATGLFETRYTRDAQGRITSLSYHKSDGAPYLMDLENYKSYSLCVYSYDSRGNISQELYYSTNKPSIHDDDDSDKGSSRSVDSLAIQYDGETMYRVAGMEYGYDQRNNIAMSWCYDGVGKLGEYEDGISGYMYVYNEDGRVTSQRLYNEKMLPFSPSDLFYDYTGYFEEAYTYDRLGRLQSISYYDANGTITEDSDGTSKHIYGYDKMGNRISDAQLDKLGRTKLCVEIKYSVSGKLVSKAYRDGLGRLTLCEKGYARLENYYDVAGNLMYSGYLDENNLSMVNNDKGFAYAILRHNSDGQVTSITYYGADGEPMMNNLEGYSSISAEYDNKGQIIEQTYYNEKGEPMINALDGYSSYKLEYDELGNEISALYCDENGAAMLNPFKGYSLFTREFDEYGNVCAEAYYDENGSPTLNANGYAFASAEFDKYGHRLYIAFFGKDGEPIVPNNKYLDYASSKLEYDENGRLVNESYYGADGELRIFSVYGYAEVRYEYDEDGNEIGVSYFGEDGTPIIGVYTDYASRKAKYVDGRKTEEAFFDESGNPMVSTDYGSEYASMKKEYDQDGNLLSEAYYGIGGKPMLFRSYTDEYASARYEYDEYGNRVKSAYFGEDGKPIIVGSFRRYAAITREYDSSGRCIAEAYFGEDGKPIVNDESMDYCASVRYTYDDHGNVVLSEYFDVDGNVISGAYTFVWAGETYEIPYTAFVRSKYDELGHLLYSVEYSANGEQLFSRVERNTYDGYNLVKTEFFKRTEYNAVDDAVYFSEPCMGDANYSVCEMKYNDAGRLLSKAYYDENGEYIIPEPDDGRTADPDEDEEEDFYSKPAERIDYYRLEYDYDPQGNTTYIAYYRSIRSDEPTESYRMAYDKYNHLISLKCFINGQAAMLDEGYSVYTAEYSGENLISLEWRDTAGRLVVPIDAEYARYTANYDINSNLTLELFYDADGEITMPPSIGYARYKAGYNPMGLCEREEYFDAESNHVSPFGKPCLTEYYYDADGMLILSRSEDAF